MKPFAHTSTVSSSLSSPSFRPCLMDVLIVLPQLTIILQCGGVIIVIIPVLMADVSVVSVTNE